MESANFILGVYGGEAAEKEMTGQPVGRVREWHADRGWKTLPGTEKESSPNGIVVSDDGRHVFVAATTNFSVYRITRGGGDPEVVGVKVDGFPDNLRWSADRKSLCPAGSTARSAPPRARSRWTTGCG